MKEEPENIPDSIRGNKRSVANGMNFIRAIEVIGRNLKSFRGYSDWSEVTRLNSLVREHLFPGETIGFR